MDTGTITTATTYKVALGEGAWAGWGKQSLGVGIWGEALLTPSSRA